MEEYREILRILPRSISELIVRNLDQSVEEIRLYINRPVILVRSKSEIFGSEDVTSDDFTIILNKLSSFSLYAYKEEMKQGYFTLRGGHRVGIAGECICENGRVKTFKSISSLNIRISRAVVGCSDEIMKYIVQNNKVMSTLIISPPKAGKTTILRDIARNISQGFVRLKLSGKRVTIVDERSEIACSNNGIPQLDVGIRTDVLDGCLKSEGIIMAIRALSPEVIICDEIGTDEDIKSLLVALTCGVSVISTMHGNGIEDFDERVMYKGIRENKLFDRIIVLSYNPRAGSIKEIFDYKNKKVLK